jgi:hypothetical protein
MKQVQTWQRLARAEPAVQRDRRRRVARWRGRLSGVVPAQVTFASSVRSSCCRRFGEWRGTSQPPRPPRRSQRVAQLQPAGHGGHPPRHTQGTASVHAGLDRHRLHFIRPLVQQPHPVRRPGDGPLAKQLGGRILWTSTGPGAAPRQPVPLHIPAEHQVVLVVLHRERPVSTLVQRPVPNRPLSVSPPLGVRLGHPPHEGPQLPVGRGR